MKSDKEQLEKRGFLQNGEKKQYQISMIEEKISLLSSLIPKERTLGARLLGDDKCSDTVEILMQALIKENKLYPKLEICNSLTQIGLICIPDLIKQLGKIGLNQHKKVPEKEFKKKNYPLPRDIAARTIIRFGADALKPLIQILSSKETEQISEAIDAIGYICFYDYSPLVFKHLMLCFQSYLGHSVICWKIIRAMSACPESKTFLTEQYKILTDNRIKQEIKRSLSLM